jgi:hypothetical protein
MEYRDDEQQMRDELSKAMEENARLKSRVAKMELDKQILTLLADGKSIEEVALELSILASRVEIALETDYGNETK